MTSKKLGQTSVISLSAPAKTKLARILKARPTAAQKRSIEQSRGLYVFYQAKWQKK